MADVARATAILARKSREALVFTLAPKTPLLTAMWWAGKAFPRADRSPAIVPHRRATVARALAAQGAGVTLSPVGRVARGFYISEATEARR